MNLGRGLASALVLAACAGAAQAQVREPANRGFGAHEDALILARYDRDRNGLLTAPERLRALSDYGFDTAAMNVPPAIAPERRLTPAQVKTYGGEGLFDPLVLRTIFLNFDTHTWEDELAVFKGSDVKVPATMVVDGRTYRDVGVSFRGQKSFTAVGSGQKRSLNIDVGFRHKDQRLLGSNRLTLLNSAGDPSFLRSMMYMHIARDYYAAFKTNYMRVVINGENWGVYVNQQPADEMRGPGDAGYHGPVWRAPGSPRGRAGLEYWGEDPAPYQRAFELTRGGRGSPAEDWKLLINLCRVLNQTPAERLPAALAPIMDVDNALRMLAVDNVLMNADGYWTRDSDYNLYVDNAGRFHFAVHDANETMRPEGGAGDGRWPRDAGQAGGGAELSLSPLAGADDRRKVLLNRLLQVPEFKQRYLGYVRDVTLKWLDWERFGAVAMKYQAVISDEMRRDPHNIYSGQAFVNGLAVDMADSGGKMAPSGLSLKSFVEKRRAYLIGALGLK